MKVSLGQLANIIAAPRMAAIGAQAADNPAGGVRPGLPQTGHGVDLAAFAFAYKIKIGVVSISQLRSENRSL